MSAANSASAPRAAGRMRGEQVRARRRRRASECPPRARRPTSVLDGRVAEPALRHRDGAAERFVVGGIGDELEVAHEIANLAPVVEAHRADEAVRERALAQRLLERAALRVGAIEDGEVAQRERRRLRAPREQLLDDEVRFVALVEAAHGRDALAARGAWGAASCPCAPCWR